MDLSGSSDPRVLQGQNSPHRHHGVAHALQDARQLRELAADEVAEDMELHVKTFVAGREKVRVENALDEGSEGPEYCGEGRDASRGGRSNW